MEKETFKVAKDILEKYAPHQLQSMTSQNFVRKFKFYFMLYQLCQSVFWIQINQRALPSINNRPQFNNSGRQLNMTPNMRQTPVIMPSSVKPSRYYPILKFFSPTFLLRPCYFIKFINNFNI